MELMQGVSFSEGIVFFIVQSHIYSLKCSIFFFFFGELIIPSLILFYVWSQCHLAFSSFAPRLFPKMISFSFIAFWLSSVKAAKFSPVLLGNMYWNLVSHFEGLEWEQSLPVVELGVFGFRDLLDLPCSTLLLWEPFQCL